VTWLRRRLYHYSLLCRAAAMRLDRPGYPFHVRMLDGLSGVLFQLAGKFDFSKEDDFDDDADHS
jgi:hypothetical protein